MPLLGVFLKYISRDMPFITVIPRILSQNLMIFFEKVGILAKIQLTVL